MSLTTDSLPTIPAACKTIEEVLNNDFSIKFKSLSKFIERGTTPERCFPIVPEVPVARILSI
jgi:hypothetical protein